MYTVIILSKEAEECFNSFRPLFEKRIENDEIGICRWIESGSDIDTALPELTDLVSERDEWRAVIVRTAPSAPTDAYPTVGVNPYDFKIYRHGDGHLYENGRVKDAEVPLVFLTHLLGGIPKPMTHFTTEIQNDDPDKVPTTVFVHDKEFDRKYGTLEERELMHDVWMDSHRIDAEPPAEIMLLTARYEDAASYAKAKQVWENHFEIESSEFWRRNMYPANARFMVTDIKKAGYYQQQNDMFRLWTTVMMLCVNKTHYDSLQANRLYNVSVRIDRNELHKALQDYSDRLNVAKTYFEAKIHKEEKEAYESYEKQLDLSTNVSVNFYAEDYDSLTLDSSEFGLFKHLPKDIPLWEGMCNDVTRQMILLKRHAARELERAGGEMRQKAVVTNDEVIKASKFQLEDLEYDMDEEYHNVVETQTILPDNEAKILNKLEAQKEETEKSLKRRLEKNSFWSIIIGMLALYAICLIPTFFSTGSYVKAGVICLSMMAITFLAAWIVVLVQRKQLNHTIYDYQTEVNNVLAVYDENSSEYSNFLSSVASLTHGNNYIRKSKKIVVSYDDVRYYKQKYTAKADSLLSDIIDWGTAYHVPVNTANVTGYLDSEELMSDADLSDIYSLDDGNKYEVPLNRSGKNYISPFSFVKKMIIAREEIFDLPDDVPEQEEASEETDTSNEEGTTEEGNTSETPVNETETAVTEA